ncbi:AAA family ATPase [Neolewinella antarctica]|uniref:ATPase dynein-related AAA domain-containing protein n=1 Tax=Neolewinella antarctica TaxID=442734 RepID=A0ABX0XG51_9BACT|nr:MoxR family ATPase [Neolewinella antarctica]NJC28299.1 hypothetical protein [Neolewinella antarctica]
MNPSQKLPRGAAALLIALVTPTQNNVTGIPVLLWGRPGVGKSSFIEGLARPDFPVTTLIASIHDPTDFSGLPILEDGKVRYATPQWVDSFSETGNGILFLDELSTAPPSVQSALLRVVFERRVGFHDLPPGVRIVAAANPPDLMVGGWELSPPLRNRFVHLNWDIDADLYINALLSGWQQGNIQEVDTKAHAVLLGQVKARVAAFLRLQPSYLHANPEDNPYGFASPRTWDFVAALFTSAELLGYDLHDTQSDGLWLDLAAGCLGEGIAIALIEYLRNLRLPPPADVLDGKVSLDVTDLNDGELYVLFASLNPYLKAAVGTADLLPYSTVYLDLMATTFDDGRRDIAFVPLRELAQSGWLPEVFAAAQQANGDGGSTVTDQIERFFADEGLNQFIDVLS